MSTEFAVSKSDALALYEGNQASLAKDLGVTRQYINKIPDGELPEWMALKLRFVLHPDAFKRIGRGSKKPPQAGPAPQAEQGAERVG